MKFSVRIGDLEVRSCGDHLMSSDDDYRAEMVKWSVGSDKKPYCFTVAYWDLGSENYNMQFVGNRPFALDSSDFMFMAETGQIILDGFYESVKLSRG